MNYMTEEKKEEAPIKEAEEKKEETAPTEAVKEEPAKEEEEKEVEVPKKFKKLVEEIETLSILDLAELVKILEKKFGVSSQAPMVVAAQVGEESAGDGAPEKSSYNIELKAIGDKKIEVIKVVRDITQKGLKEAKDLVDAVATGAQVIKENVKKEEAEDFKKKLQTAGATIELK